MLAPPLGAYLMRTSLWVPIIIGFVCLLLAVSLTVVMPETRFTALARDSMDDEQVHHGPGPSESEEISESQGSEAETDIKSPFDAAVGHTLSTVGFVLKHRNLVLLMACFFSTDFAQQSLAILLRYVSARYSIPLAKVFNSFEPFPISLSILCRGETHLRLHFVTMTILTRVPVDLRPATCSPSRPLDRCWHMASFFPSLTPHWSAGSDSYLASRIFTSPG